MTRHRFTVSFDLAIEIEDGDHEKVLGVGLTPEQIAEAIQRKACDSRDGRLPFDVEQALTGVAYLAKDAIDGAIFHAVHDEMFPGSNPRSKRDFARRDREIARREKLVTRVHVAEDNTTIKPALPKARCHVCGWDGFDIDSWCVPCGAATCETL